MSQQLCNRTATMSIRGNIGSITDGYERRKLYRCGWKMDVSPQVKTSMKKVVENHGWWWSWRQKETRLFWTGMGSQKRGNESWGNHGSVLWRLEVHLKMYDAKREGKKKHNQICGPPTMFLAFKISYLLFSNLTHKTETGRRLVIATLLDQSTVWIANGKQAC